jgi:1-deoxy-D-xylulose-5-phosphate reductoisomerase
MMNKGLEVIEATRFFPLAPSQLEVVVQRQSVMHAFVFFSDGSVKAQLAAPDMRLPIGYALSYPERLDVPVATAATRRAMGLEGGVTTLTFEPVDHERFPAVRLAYSAVERGGTYPAVLSAANEEAGRAFLQGKVRFVDIAALVAAALDAHAGADAVLPEIEEADRWARSFTRDAISAKT